MITYEVWRKEQVELIREMALADIKDFDRLIAENILKEDNRPSYERIRERMKADIILYPTIEFQTLNKQPPHHLGEMQEYHVTDLPVLNHLKDVHTIAWQDNSNKVILYRYFEPVTLILPDISTSKVKVKSRNVTRINIGQCELLKTKLYSAVMTINNYRERLRDEDLTKEYRSNG